ncbi:SatD family protein [Carboxydochorda subterranea]|uniref:SatD family protein n=1 Tax=Carboxydichorda subterranea TaxID=3109565 RepID=A0ABZ1BTM1_9FIRM|nr:SatD family protein [Limnochorda sp. L945t]WRP16129.1 SatD family protein [Limnochorda sp. L945t]
MAGGRAGEERAAGGSVSPGAAEEPGKPRWIVITADVIGSRAVEPKGALMGALAESLEAFNRAWAGLIAVPFSGAAGDEVQGVLVPGVEAFAMVRRLRWAARQAAVRPALRLRVGIGWGTIDTPMQAASSWEMDGPAFHRARQALARAGEVRGETTRFSGPDPEHEAWVNVTLSLVDAIVQRWTQAQWEAVDAYERRGTYAAAASEVGVALQNVQKRCAAARWPVIREAERALGRSLERAAPVER